MHFIALLSVVGLVASAGAQDQRVVKITVGNAAVRSGPSKEYNRVTVLPAGIKLPVVKQEGSWYRIALGDRQEAYVSSVVAELVPAGSSPSQAKVTNISSDGYEKGTRVRISLSAPVAFRVVQRLRPAALVVELYNTRLQHYGVRQLEGDRAVLAIERLQVTTNCTEVTFHLPQRQQMGYDAYYDETGRALFLDIRQPLDTAGLQGRLIGVDAGHGGRLPGAKGPTGFAEKDANLDIAIRLKQLLETAGARVFMTRETDTAYGTAGQPTSADLDPRRELTRRAQVDLFVSVHNNHSGRAGDGTRGTETYYWTPMSILPSKIIQANLCASLGTPYRYTSWRPFYVLRATDCPRVLVECCYMSDASEEAALKTVEFRHAAAVGIFSGIREYFDAAPLTDGLEAVPPPLTDPSSTFG